MLAPITKNEFSFMLRRCRPPEGWPSVLAIANSGGPDSTCLLYLLAHAFIAPGAPQHQTSEGKGKRKRRSPRLFSLTVDHDLQASSADMATHCASFASRLGVDHLCSKITWGKDGVPSKPTEAFERVARDVRYDFLFNDMGKVGTNVLALAHHLDDQVETSLMRLGKGSTLLGARGMRPIRRWGMSENPNDSEQRNLRGMESWMIRPLLSVGKDRILATCEANELEYVTDKTNFQPDVTLRNAIRHVIVKGGKTDELANPGLKQQLVAINDRISGLGLGATVSSGQENLRRTISTISSTADQIDAQVDKFLDDQRRPSHLGTLVLPQSLFQSAMNPLAQKALIERVLRYVSPDPWGSLRAQGFGRSSSIDRIMDNLQRPMTATTPAFVTGSHVLWQPGCYRNGKFKKTPPAVGDVPAWITSRQPPAKKNIGLSQQGTASESLGPRDITQLVAGGMRRLDSDSSSQDVIDILWDNRFRIRIRPSNVPKDIKAALDLPDASLALEADEKWYQPRLVLRTGDSRIDIPFKTIQKSHSRWARIEFIRPLSSV